MRSIVRYSLILLPEIEHKDSVKASSAASYTTEAASVVKEQNTSERKSTNNGKVRHA